MNMKIPVMNPEKFPESNCTFGPPPDLDESQCMSIPAYKGNVVGGSVDGCPVTVVAWKPTPAEIELINQGKPIFLSFLSRSMPPHFPCMDFSQAIKPA